MSISDCEHDYLFVASGTGLGKDMVSDFIMVCSKCGQFAVQTRKNGVVATTTFMLTSPSLVQAAGRYVEYLRENGVKFSEDDES